MEICKEKQLKNYTRKYHKTNYYDDPIKRKKALDKRFKTNLLKYGCKFCQTVEKMSENVKKSHQKALSILNDIKNIPSKEEIFNFLNLDETHYKNFIGKGKYRTLLKHYPNIYKGIMVHTEPFEKFYNFKIKNHKINFVYRLLISGKYGFNLPRDCYCRCGKNITFDRITQQILLRTFCRNPDCIMSANSIEYFKYKYPDNWEAKYNELRILPNQTVEKKLLRKRAGRLSYQKRNPTKKLNKFHNTGKNEEKLLDDVEKIIGYKIDRNFTVCGYYPDGYCHENNTIYEVYEKYHKNKKMIDYDKQREKEIKNELNCKFVVIWDI